MPAKADIGTGGLRGRLHPAKNDLKLGTKPRLGWKAVFFSPSIRPRIAALFSLSLSVFSLSLCLCCVAGVSRAERTSGGG